MNQYIKIVIQFVLYIIFLSQQISFFWVVISSCTEDRARCDYCDIGTLGREGALILNIYIYVYIYIHIYIYIPQVIEQLH